VNLSAHEKLQRALYWTRTVVQHEPAHIVTDQSRGGVVRYFLACRNTVSGGRTCMYRVVEAQQAHVCVGCVKEVTS